MLLFKSTQLFLNKVSREVNLALNTQSTIIFATMHKLYTVQESLDPINEPRDIVGSHKVKVDTSVLGKGEMSVTDFDGNIYTLIKVSEDNDEASGLHNASYQSKSDDYAEATITWHIEDKVTKVSASIQLPPNRIFALAFDDKEGHVLQELNTDHMRCGIKPVL